MLKVFLLSFMENCENPWASVHVRLTPQWLRFMKQSQVYMPLYKSDHTEYSVFVHTQFKFYTSVSWTLANLKNVELAWYHNLEMFSMQLIKATEWGDIQNLDWYCRWCNKIGLSNRNGEFRLRCLNTYVNNYSSLKVHDSGR